MDVETQRSFTWKNSGFKCLLMVSSPSDTQSSMLIFVYCLHFVLDQILKGHHKNKCCVIGMEHNCGFWVVVLLFSIVLGQAGVQSVVGPCLSLYPLIQKLMYQGVFKWIRKSIQCNYAGYKTEHNYAQSIVAMKIQNCSFQVYVVIFYEILEPATGVMSVCKGSKY